MSPGFMENVALPDSTRPCSIQAISRKKRARLEMSSQTPIREDRARDTPKQNEVLMLREALKSERDTLRKLHIELEEERGASMTAANEAMAMITRLQEEKAAVLMEARRYRRVAEERETHNQEAISLLKDALLTKEDDLLALQDLLNAYRETFLRLEAEQQGNQGNYLEEGRDKEQLLLLEGPNATPCLYMDSNYAKYHGQKQLIRTGASIWRTVDGHKEFECHDDFQGSKQNQVRPENSSRNFTDCTDCSHDHEGIHDEEGYEGASEEDHYTGNRQPKISGGFDHQNTYCERQTFQGHMQCEDHNSVIGNDNQSQEQYLDDVSVSIFARVKRLEERFEYLRQNQALEYQRLNVAHQADAVVLDDLELELMTRPDWESAPKVSCHSMEPERLVEDSVNGDLGEPEEVLKCLSFERIRMDLSNEQCSSPHEVAELGSECRDNRMNLHRVDKTSFAEINDDGGEGVHDVYEVQYEIKRPFVRPPEQDLPLDNNGQPKCETGNMDMLILGTLQEADKDIRVMPLPRNQAQPELCTAADDKLSVKISLLDVKDVRANVADEDVRQLKVRLQALEGERVFMKEAIDSLRKENKDLKVLQEIAQQLRELKSDVRRTEAPEQQDPLPLFSFFKGILSLTGLQNLAAMEGSRCFLRSSFSPCKHEQGGLLHILNKTQNSVCVTRERKVNFNRT